MSQENEKHRDLVGLVEKGLEMAEVSTVSVVEGGIDADGYEQFLAVPKGTDIKRVRDLVVPEGKTRSIGNAEGLLAVVSEEARRRGNATGDHMTVIFDPGGGNFFPDDKNRYNPDNWLFQRKLSAQFHALKGVLNRECSHQDLLRLMSQIRFFTVDFAGLYSAMRRVRIDKKTAINSQPRIQNGKCGSEVAINFTIEGENGGNGQVTFPSEFICRLPVVSMASRQYDFEIEVDSWLDEKALLFALRCPSLDAIKTQAILDEIAAFTTAAKTKLPELLVVTDL